MPPTLHSAESAECPTRRELRARLFWTARWLIGRGDYYRGRLEGTIRDGTPRAAAEAIVLRPRPGDEVYDAEGGRSRDCISARREVVSGHFSVLRSADAVGPYPGSSPKW